jgi:hypothetical protein
MVPSTVVVIGTSPSGATSFATPKSSHLHEVVPVPLEDKQVVRLHVAMDDAHVVRGLQGITDLPDDAHRPGPPPAARAQQLGEALALEHLHDAVHPGPPRGRGLLDEVEDLHDVARGDLVDRARLVEEALDEVRVPRVLGPEHLHRRWPTEAHVPGLEDPTHRPLSEDPLEPELPEHVTRLLRSDSSTRRSGGCSPPSFVGRSWVRGCASSSARATSPGVMNPPSASSSAHPA